MGWYWHGGCHPCDELAYRQTDGRADPRKRQKTKHKHTHTCVTSGRKKAATWSGRSASCCTSLTLSSITHSLITYKSILKRLWRGHTDGCWRGGRHSDAWLMQTLGAEGAITRSKACCHPGIQRCACGAHSWQRPQTISRCSSCSFAAAVH